VPHPSLSATVRRSFALPRTLVDDVVACAPQELKGNLNQLVAQALREYAEHRRRDVFATAMAAMAADPAVQTECRAIAAELAATDADGLGER
jgi:hypothetical protein